MTLRMVRELGMKGGAAVVEHGLVGVVLSRARDEAQNLGVL
jgi:hypothetical protein